MNRKIIILFAFITLCLIRFASAFSGSGTGTFANPFVATNCTQLSEMHNSVNANYTLGNNIDCSETSTWNSGAGFSPVGNSTSPFQFSGSLRGQNYNITNLYINRTTNNIGLFFIIELISVQASWKNVRCYMSLNENRLLNKLFLLINL